MRTLKGVAGRENLLVLLLFSPGRSRRLNAVLADVAESRRLRGEIREFTQMGLVTELLQRQLEDS